MTIDKYIDYCACVFFTVAPLVFIVALGAVLYKLLS